MKVVGDLHRTQSHNPPVNLCPDMTSHRCSLHAAAHASLLRSVKDTSGWEHCVLWCPCRNMSEVSNFVSVGVTESCSNTQQDATSVQPSVQFVILY